MPPECRTADRAGAVSGVVQWETQPGGKVRPGGQICALAPSESSEQVWGGEPPSRTCGCLTGSGSGLRWQPRGGKPRSPDEFARPDLERPWEASGRLGSGFACKPPPIRFAQLPPGPAKPQRAPPTPGWGMSSSQRASEDSPCAFWKSEPYWTEEGDVVAWLDLTG